MGNLNDTYIRLKTHVVLENVINCCSKFDYYFFVYKIFSKLAFKPGFENKQTFRMCFVNSKGYFVVKEMEVICYTICI